MTEGINLQPLDLVGELSVYEVQTVSTCYAQRCVTKQGNNKSGLESLELFRRRGDGLEPSLRVKHGTFFLYHGSE